MDHVTEEYGGFTDVARALALAFPDLSGRNLKAFTRQQVHVWWGRRERNGFPGKHTVVVRGARRELFKLSEVVDWFAGYEPSTGGRKPVSGAPEPSGTEPSETQA
jgi:hypothetical protein